MWRALTPELAVFDVAEAQRWYRDVLGAEVAWTYGSDLGCVRIGAVEVFLARASEAIPAASCYVHVDDADAVHAAVLARGAEVVAEPRSTGRGTREFTLRDPNGHLFRVGHQELPPEQMPQVIAGEPPLSEPARLPPEPPAS